MHPLRFLLVITATALLPLAARAQTNAPAATLAEQIESARRQPETRFGTNRPPAFEQAARANAERAYYSPKFAAAVQAGDTNALLQLFRELPELMDSRNLDSPTVLGKAPLTMAAERGDLPMVDFLLRRKASPDAVRVATSWPVSGPALHWGPGHPDIFPRAARDCTRLSSDSREGVVTEAGPMDTPHCLTVGNHRWSSSVGNSSK